MGQSTAHSAATVISRGTKPLVGSMLMGRPEARSKGKITDSCCGQREGAPLPLIRLKRKWLQKCWVKLSQKEIKACWVSAGLKGLSSSITLLYSLQTSGSLQGSTEGQEPQIHHSNPYWSRTSTLDYYSLTLIESSMLEKPSKIMDCNHCPSTAKAKPCPQVPHLHGFFWALQAWCF